jgi:CRP/FNR family transcriptional regulator, cyclic AMP receptor protein
MSPTPREETLHLSPQFLHSFKRKRAANKEIGQKTGSSPSGSQLGKAAIGLTDFRARFKSGITNLSCKAKGTVFSQGDPSDRIFFIQKGKVKLTVISTRGREAIVGVLGANEFVGEQCLAGQMFREMTVTAVEDCSLLRIEREEMLRSLREDSELSMTFVSCLLSQNLHLLDELVDHFFNHSEKRLARLLLSQAHYGKDRKTEKVIPKIDQETLAEMVGTTRGRISFFMNKFRKQGFIDYENDYKGSLRVHSSLLNLILRD